MRSCRRLVAVVLGMWIAPFVVAQGLSLRDDTRSAPQLVAFDSARDRLVELGRHGETREFDGSEYLRRATAGPTHLIGAMVYRSAAAHTFAYGMSYDTAQASFVAETWIYDGVQWQQVSPANQPAARSNFVMSYDSLRDRVVLFGGILNAGGIATDTWEWDGTDWMQIASSGPPARTRSCMAFDDLRGVTVLYGGQVASLGAQNDHWEWNGATWTQLTFSSDPGPLTDAAMAFDSQRGVAVLYGGFENGSLSNELWEFDGTNWQLVPFVNGPGPRWQHDMVYDDVAGNTVLRGFDSVTGDRELWRWSGSVWIPITSLPELPALSVGATACPDALNGGLLLTGGVINASTWRFANGTWTRFDFSAPPSLVESAAWSDGSNSWMFSGRNGFGAGVFVETWRWNGAAWQAIALPASPPPRSEAAVAYDPLRGEAVLFGGGGSNPLDDTWVFDGTTWIQRTPATVPPGRRGHGMAYDPVRDRIVMFGGRTGLTTNLADTWEWDGSNWTQATPLQSPPGYGRAALGFDPATDRIVLSHAIYSESTTPTEVELWSYDGATWTPVQLASQRVAYWEHALVTPAGDDRLLLVEGNVVCEFEQQPATVEMYGSECGVDPPRITARDLPTIDNPAFGIDVIDGGPANVTALAGSSTDANLPLFGCTLLLDVEATTFVSKNQSGFGSHDLSIPAQPSLLGSDWFFQALGFRPTAPNGIALSRGLSITIGN